MNMDILSQLDPTPESSGRRINLEDLPEYAKGSCKKCYGRGWQKRVKNVGRKEWVLDKYVVCKCVLKSKRFPELMEKVRKADEEARKEEEIQSSTLPANENEEKEPDVVESETEEISE